MGIPLFDSARAKTPPAGALRFVYYSLDENSVTLVSRLHNPPLENKC